ncbi:hypothetical protein RB594_006020 [Gaeumannomyces avenae]
MGVHRSVNTRGALADVFPIIALTRSLPPFRPYSSSKPWVYRPLTQGKQIRLIRLHRWIPVLGVRATIMHVNLENSPPYDAISYHWGTSEERRRLTVLDETDASSTPKWLEVFKPTYDALYSLSSPWKTRIIWIDAVCIDQSQHTCNTEKGPQPWFMRVWVIQEVAAASLNSPRIWYGGRLYDWASLLDAFGLLEDFEMTGFLHTIHQGRVAFSHLLSMRSMDDVRKGTFLVDLNRWSKGLMENPAPLLYLLESSMAHQASDARDKVFALLGLMGEDPPPTLTPDYSSETTAESVYIKTAEYLLTDEKPLAFLQLAGVGVSRRHRALPSWVPDWADSPDRGASMSSTLWHKSHIRYYYQATGSAGPVFSIKRVGDCKALALLWATDPLASTLPVNCPKEADSDKPSGLGSVPSQPLREVFWRVLTGDLHMRWMMRPAPMSRQDDYDNWVSFMAEMAGYLAADSRDTHVPVHDAAFWGRHDAGLPFSNAMASCAVGRRVCVTAAGRLGCVAPLCQVGDEVVLIHGAPTPFVIRKASAETGADSDLYELVGPCYMHGVMDGEASGTRGAEQLFDLWQIPRA